LERLKENIQNTLNEEGDQNLFTKNELNFIISKMGYNHIKNNNFAQKEILFVEKIYKVWDSVFNDYEKYKDKNKQLKKLFISKFKKRNKKINELEEVNVL
jgi:predicted XRE-type DNA-binding protein